MASVDLRYRLAETSSRMKPASRHRRSLTLLTLVALVLTTLANGVVRAPAQAAGYVDPVLGAVTLCTPGSGAAGTGRVPPQHLAEHCPLCTLLAPLAIAPPLSSAPLTFNDAVEAPPPSHPVVLPTHRLHLGGIGSRAPPFPA
jgi:hypothetical protein